MGCRKCQMVGGTLVVTTKESPLVDMQDMTRKGSKHSTEGVINTQGKTGRRQRALVSPCP